MNATWAGSRKIGDQIGSHLSGTLGELQTIPCLPTCLLVKLVNSGQRYSSVQTAGALSIFELNNIGLLNHVYTASLEIATIVWPLLV